MGSPHWLSDRQTHCRSGTVTIFSHCMLFDDRNFIFSIDKTCVSTVQLGKGWLVQELWVTPAQTRTDKDILWYTNLGFKIMPLYPFWSVNRYPQYNCIIRHQLTANFPKSNSFLEHQIGNSCISTQLCIHSPVFMNDSWVYCIVESLAAICWQAVTSMDMSPRGEFLAVSMLDEPGLFIWSNRSLYMHVPLKGIFHNISFSYAESWIF